MNERVPLSFLLAEKSSQKAPVEPIVPFPAFRGEDPCIVTAVLERTAICGSTTDHYERQAVKHQDVLVDSAVIEWKTRAETATKQNGQSTPWLRSKKATSEERVAAREKSDRKARENQAEVARVAAAEQARDAELRAQGLKDLSDRATPPVLAKRHAEHESAPSDMEERPSNVEAKSEPLKFCPGCKQKKPKSAFPEGKGFFKCNECRAAQVQVEAMTGLGSLTQKIADRESLADRGLKHCSGCDQDKRFEEFDRNASKADGYQTQCKKCRSDRWTAGSTAMRGARHGAEAPSDGPETIAPSDRVSTPPRRRNGRPALTFTELLSDLKQLSTYCRELEDETRDLKAENEQLRAEQAGLYEELHTIIGSFKKRRGKG